MQMSFPKFKADSTANIRKMCNMNNFDETALDLLLKMVQLEPGRRISAKAALQHPYFNENWNSVFPPRFNLKEKIN